MTTPTVRKGDRIRATTVCEGTVRDVLYGGQMVQLETSGGVVLHCFVTDRPGISVTVEHLEPEWRPGDVAKDAKGRVVHYLPGGKSDPHPWATVKNGMYADLADADLARPLTPLVLRGVPQVTP